MNDRRKQPMALAGVAAFSICLIAIAAVGFYATARIDQTIEGRSTHLAQLRFQVAKLARKSVTKQPRANTLARDFLLTEATPSAAAASSQSRLIDQITKAGGRVESIRVLDNERDGNLSKIAIEARMYIRTGALRSLLLDVERNTPIAIIDNLTVSHRAGQLVKAADQAARDFDPWLSVTMTVGSYLLASRKGDEQ